ncbi:hypothetical protein [Streptomyces sp. NBC_01455]|uniref:hypothetical protein n=1 Tax=Streptomyces sp. NBC_01455 TaxID=2903874 RepID=UPI002E314B4D|nr:hypothetical protein [Streptomyces sp. NBC_01455]
MKNTVAHTYRAVYWLTSRLQDPADAGPAEALEKAAEVGRGWPFLADGACANSSRARFAWSRTARSGVMSRRRSSTF